MSSWFRLGTIVADGFAAPVFLMYGLHDFGLHVGYWSCFLLTMAAGVELGAVLWGLPEYLGRKGGA